MVGLLTSQTALITTQTHESFHAKKQNKKRKKEKEAEKLEIKRIYLEK